MTVLQAWLERIHAARSSSRYQQTRQWLLLGSALTILMILVQLYQGGSSSTWTIAGLAIMISFVFALASELLGRWMFYEKKAHSGL